jgi:hypothetical protein
MLQGLLMSGFVDQVLCPHPRPTNALHGGALFQNRRPRPHAVRTASRVAVYPDEPPPREITAKHVSQALPRPDPAIESPTRDR